MCLKHFTTAVIYLNFKTDSENTIFNIFERELSTILMIIVRVLSVVYRNRENNA
jgi:hypothetical protein